MEDIEHQPIENIQLSVNGNFIQCQQARVRFRQSLNNVHGLLLTAAVERFNRDLGHNDLFKRSLILIKMWIKFESRRFSHLGDVTINLLIQFNCDPVYFVRLEQAAAT